ncbi:MAG: NlpC/P60 family protein [Gammaproteobacteria bacterium]|nr:NlpC/P60 family protein [Gammaproteobacteria bacterium]
MFQLSKIISAFMCISFILVGQVACSGSAVQPAAKINVVPGKTVDLNNTKQVKKILASQYNEWKSVKHRDGGLSKSGIDCSGLVYLTFAQKLGIEIPRSTELQSSIGKSIKQSQLKPGDLVFFKTGFKQRHVGIYVGNQQFLHTSSSKGVTMSRLDNVYWAKNYWQSRRVQF